jgi:hypothetical protein
MDSFQFSSRRLNPVMRLLGFGPVVAGAASDLGISSHQEMAQWSWLGQTPKELAWLLGRLIQNRGPDILLEPGLAVLLNELAGRLKHQVGIRPPRDDGQPLHQICGDEWQARFWRAVTNRNRARPEKLHRWLRALEGLLVPSD